MNKTKIVFVWTDETALRERFQGVLRAHGTRSCYDLGIKGSSKTILLSERYTCWIRRTARDKPEKARVEDLSRSYSYLQAKVERWLAGWRSVDWSDVLLVDVQFLDWIVDDGVEMQIGTVFVATVQATAVCLIDELEALGENFEVDLRLLETERRHLESAATSTGELLP
jgi:hypothetical protein